MKNNSKSMIGAVVLILVILVGALGFLIGHLTAKPTPVVAPTAEPATAAPASQTNQTPAAAVLTSMSTQVTPKVTPEALTPTYSLAGQKYQAWINGSGQDGQYDAVWTNSGWLWQPNLPPEGQRSGFVMSITIEEGRYTFAGVSCQLYLDVSRNGQGANNPETVGYGNGLAFNVDTSDNRQAWAFIVCDPTDVTGFSIQYQGPLP